MTWIARILIAVSFLTCASRGIVGIAVNENKTIGDKTLLRGSRPSEATNSILLCANPRLTSPCVSVLWDDLQCTGLPLEWDNIVTSVALRGSGQQCILYRDYGCNGPTFEVKGYTPELENFENEVSSFRCFAIQRC